MQRAGLMTINFLFVDGARAELFGDHVVMHEVGKQPSTPMLIDALPINRIDEMLLCGVIKIVAKPMEVLCHTPTPATSA